MILLIHDHLKACPINTPWLPWVQQYSRWLLVAILGVYAALLLPVVGRQGISWDEQNDLWVAQSYLARPDGWLAGSNIDPSQTRLPMFVVAVVYGVMQDTSLLTARLVSIGIGALTLIGVYVFGKSRLDQRRALLATFLLATSPFFLAFARVAFTETDIYLACALVWLLVAVDRFQAKPALGRAALVGVLFGLALSAKFTALALLPALGYAVWQKPGPAARQSLPLLLWSAWLAGWTLGGVWAAAHYLEGDAAAGGRILIFLLVLAAWIVPLVWAYRHRDASAPAWAMMTWITCLGLLTFLVLPPEHLTNPNILGGLLDRFQGEMGFRPAFVAEAAGLHLLSILFKSSPLIGISLLVGLLAALREWSDGRLNFLLLVGVCYFAGLLILPLAQTFYSVPLLPVLALLAADAFWRFYRRCRRTAIGAAVLLLVFLGVDMAYCYPDYNLNGYQWLGARQLMGRSSIGYRSVVQTPSDGVEQSIRWLNEHAGQGDAVQAYLLPWHIVYANAPHPAYRLLNGFNDPIASPDYVVVHINALVRQSWWARDSRGDVFQYPYDPLWLETHYVKVFSVPRAMDIEMASVWQKK